MNEQGPPTDTIEDVLNLMGAELDRQVELWGEQNHPDGTGPHTRQFCWEAAYSELWAKAQVERSAAAGTLTWAEILTEEYAEAIAEGDPERLRVELVQLAAVAIRWADAIARRTADQQTAQQVVRDPRYTRDSQHYQHKSKKIYDGMTDG